MYTYIMYFMHSPTSWSLVIGMAVIKYVGGKGIKFTKRIHISSINMCLQRRPKSQVNYVYFNFLCLS